MVNKHKLTRILIYVISGILAGIVTTVIWIGDDYRNMTTYKYPYKDDAYLKLMEYKSQLVTVTDSIILSNSPNSSLSGFEVVSKCLDYDIDLIFVLAQGKLESNFGTSGLAKQTNSVWNVGAYDNLKVNQILDIHKYPHPNSSIEPYIKLIKSRYLSKGKFELNLLENFVDIDGHRYATDKEYEYKLRGLYDSISKSSISEIYAKYKKQYLIYKSY